MGEKILKRSRRKVHESKLRLLRELRAKADETSGQIYTDILDGVRGHERDVVADVIVGLAARLGERSEPG